MLLGEFWGLADGAVCMMTGGDQQLRMIVTKHWLLSKILLLAMLTGRSDCNHLQSMFESSELIGWISWRERMTQKINNF